MNNALANSETLNVAAAVGNRSVVRVEKGQLGPIFYSLGTIDELETAVRDWFAGERDKTFTIGYINPHVFNLAWENPTLRRFLAECDVAAVDGLGVALAVCLMKRRYQTRTVMTPLFDRILANESIPQTKAILIGGSEPVLAKGADAINNASFAIKVTATCNGYEPVETYLDLIGANPSCDVVLVAMGSPRSEELIVEAAERITGKLLWNIGGGTLHFYAGTQPRTPAIVSAAGLQWLWRITHQPSIAPRYAFGIPLFLTRLLKTLMTPQTINNR